MKIKELIFNIFKKLSLLISGKGLAKLPFATNVYQFIYRKLKPNGIVEIITAEKHKMFVDSRDTGMAPYFIMHGDFIPDEAEVLKKILRPGMVFVDVGANIGYFSLIAAKLAGPAGRIFSFEPDENNFSLLQKNINANGYKNITAIKKAVSDRTGVAKFYLEKENLCAHSLTPKENRDFTETETTSLDDYFKDKKVDVVKIDVEGAEPDVLKGMKNIIKKNEKLIIITEFYPEAIKRFGHSPRNYLEELQSCGFKLYRIDEPKGVTVLDDKMIDAISRGEKIKKLINIFAKKV